MDGTAHFLHVAGILSQIFKNPFDKYDTSYYNVEWFPKDQATEYLIKRTERKMYKIVRKKELNSAVTLMDIEAPFVAKKANATKRTVFNISGNSWPII